MKLLMLKGLPASGKTTYARELVKTQGYTRVNKDDLRAMMHNKKYSKVNETEVINCRNHIVACALTKNKNIVVDDTNFNYVHEKELRLMAELHNAEFEVKFIDTPLDECIKRDLARSEPVGEAVIRQMYNQYLKDAKPAVAPPVYDHTLPSAIICDIDGTLANGHFGEQGKRSPYDMTRVVEDDAYRHVAHLLEVYKAHYQNNADIGADMQILIVSGRGEECRADTEAWLVDKQVRWDHLFMRPAGDKRKDDVIKEEIYQREIAGKYNVEFVLDDRDRIVKKWRSLGLKCFQVAEGNF